MPIKARQPHQVPCSTAALLLATQTAVAHAAADGTRPVLQSQYTQHDNPCRSSLLSAENTPLCLFNQVHRWFGKRRCRVQTFSPSMGVGKTSSRFCFMLLDVTICCKDCEKGGFLKLSELESTTLPFKQFYLLLLLQYMTSVSPRFCLHGDRAFAVADKLWNSLLLDLCINGLTILYLKKMKTYLITTPLNTCQLSNSQIMFYCLPFSVWFCDLILDYTLQILLLYTLILGSVYKVKSSCCC